MSQYDRNGLAGNYYARRDQNHPLRQKIYQTWINECGNLHGKHVLDLGCGYGYSSSLLANEGAMVLGLDSSRDMLKRTKASEDGRGLNPRYQWINSIVELPIFSEKFDLITAAYALHYLKMAELEELLRRLSLNLVLGGKIIAIILDPDQPVWHVQGRGMVYPYTEKWQGRPYEDDAEILIEWYDDQGNKYGEAVNYYVKKETYERMLGKYGFGELKWIKTEGPTGNKLVSEKWTGIPSCIVVFSVIFKGNT